MDALDAFLASGTTYDAFVEVGKDLQSQRRVRLEGGNPPGPVDVVVSVPTGSGVLLSATATGVGTESLVVATEMTAASTPNFYIQGVIQGDDIADDIPVTIEVYNSFTGMTEIAGYESRLSDIDVHPSGFEFNTAADINTTTFNADISVTIQARLIHDNEGTGTPGNLAGLQQVRGGFSVDIDLTNTNPAVGALTINPVTINGGVSSTSTAFDPLTAGTTILGITQPAGHTEANNADVLRTANVDAPEVYLAAGTSSYDAFVEVGKDLQTPRRIFMQDTPPVNVDVIVSVPASSGVLLSLTNSSVGTDTLTFTNMSSTTTPQFWIQGVVQGDDIADDIPVTINVFDTGTTNPTGFVSRPSDIDVHPSGFRFNTPTAINTTVFNANIGVTVQALLIHDNEGTGTPGNLFALQQVRGGFNVSGIDLTNSNPTVGVLTIDPVTINGGSSSTTTAFDPLTAGTTDIGITQPAGYTEANNATVSRTANVDAPDTWLKSTCSSSAISSADIGHDLQIERRVCLQNAAPTPVDVTIEIIGPTVATISTDPTVAGGSTITFPGITGTSTPTFFIQGLADGLGTELHITAAGYDQWITTLQIIDAGFYISTPNDFTTTTSSANRTIEIRSASLNTNGTIKSQQEVRGGASFDVGVVSSNTSVGTITLSPLTFTGGDTALTTQFDPLAVGTSTLSIVPPTGFTPVPGKTSIVATVE